jgi:molybdenum cofactor cytidylyltransferase
MADTGIVILAAGSASRFGTAKQLLQFKGKTLLRHVIDEAAAAGLEPIVVVTGAYAEEVSAAVQNTGVDLVFNEKWAEGQASGLVAGVRHMLSAHPDVRNIIFAVCDQPFVSAALFSQLREKQNDSGKPIVASAYAGTVGTPVLFSRIHVDALLGLQGDKGAKKILLEHPGDVATVDFPMGHMDIDTREDYAFLLKQP